MFSRIHKCVLFPQTNGILLLNNIKVTNVISKNDVKCYAILKNHDKLEFLINKYGGVDSLPLSKKLISLKIIYSKLTYSYRKNNKLFSSRSEKIDYYYKLLDEILISIKKVMYLTDKIKEDLMPTLINITKVSTHVAINDKIKEYIHEMILLSSEDCIVKLLKVAIKNKYKIDAKSLLTKFNNYENGESDVLFDLYWCLTSIGVEFRALNVLLEKIVKNLEDTNVVNNLKLLNSLNVSFCKINSKNVNNNIILSNHTNDDDKLTILEMQQLLLDKLRSYRNYNDDTGTLSKCDEKKLLNDTIKYVKKVLMSKIADFDDSRTLTNFIYYVTCTTNDFTITDYRKLCDRMISIINGKAQLVNCGLDGNEVAVEGLIQLMWSFQKNNLYPYRLLQMMIEKFNTMLDSSIGMGNNVKCSKALSLGQLSLFSYGLAYFNLLDIDIATKCLCYLKDYSNKSTANDSNATDEVLKKLNITWAICVSNINNLKQIHKDIIESLNNVDWNSFALKSQFEDLRKVMQIITTLKLECGLNDLKIPDGVIKMVENTGNNRLDYNNNSVTQDKVRRILQSKDIHFKSEYEINQQISVDFILFPPSDMSLNSQSDYNTNVHGDIDNGTQSGLRQYPNGLVIEIDGPYHYNLLLDPGPSGTYDKGDEISFGSAKLILNGKTVYRNRLDGLMHLLYVFIYEPSFSVSARCSEILLMILLLILILRILKRLGYNVASIPWFTGYQKSFYQIVESVLNTHRFV